MKNGVALLLLILALVVIQVSILIPVAISSRDEARDDLSVQMQELASQTTKRIETVIDFFIYNIDRTAATISLLNSYVDQQQLETWIQLEKNPIRSSFQRFFWLQMVPAANRSDYESFGQTHFHPFFQITEVFNGTQIVPAGNRSEYIPFGPAVPAFEAELQVLLGFDAASHPGTSFLVRKDDMQYVLPHITLEQEDDNSYGLLFVEFVPKRGYIMGLVDTITLITSALSVPRDDVELVAFAPEAVEEEQLLFHETSHENITSVADFNALHEFRDEFYIEELVVFNLTLMLGFRFSKRLEREFEDLGWVTTVVALSLVFVLLDVVVIASFSMARTLMVKRRVASERYAVAAQMLSYVNHELRNPLQAIMGLADLTREDIAETVPDTLSKFKILSNMGTIFRSAAFMKHIINDILDIRKLEEGKVDITISAFNVNTLVDGVCKSITPKLQEKPQLDFQVEINDNIRVINSDAFRVEQILLNFLTNAIKFTDEGFIKLSFQSVKGGVRIVVQDSGRGISEDAQQLIFQPFKQIDSQDASRYGGIGLGLYLCQMLATVLGGEIGFESIIGEGSSFWLHLGPQALDHIVYEEVDLEGISIRL